jgi:hypothetical protein
MSASRWSAGDEIAHTFINSSGGDCDRPSEHRKMLTIFLLQKFVNEIAVQVYSHSIYLCALIRRSGGSGYNSLFSVILLHTAKMIFVQFE